MSFERGTGTTPSEKHLAKISDHTFLDLWSWPNPFKKPGKELCDLLVVCGDDVLIFSDKHIIWPTGTFEVAYKRWYSRAIDESVSQIKNAARWLRSHPTKIFSDPKCKQNIPLEIPAIDRQRLHGICVASGSEGAASEYFKDPDGTFCIRPDIKGEAHTDFSLPDFMPFCIGDVAPNGLFIHIFNQSALDIVMSELDTISDFTDYLIARAEFLRSGTLGFCPSEADLLANYLRITNDGKHKFPSRADFGVPADVSFTFAQGEYAYLLRSREYRQVKYLLRPSYHWDNLIKFFTDGVLGDRQFKILDTEPSFELAERALRIMAREPRFRRLRLGEAFTGAMTELEQRNAGRFARVVKFDSSPSEGELAYVFVVLKGANEMEQSEYRRVRTAILETYVMAVLHDDRCLKRCVGIALSAISDEGSSEDLIAYEQPDWDPTLEAQVREGRALYDVMVDPTKQNHHLSMIDNTNDSSFLSMNRKERRTAERQLRKLQKKSKSTDKK